MVLTTVCRFIIDAFREGVVAGAGGQGTASKQFFGCIPKPFDNESFVRVFMAGLQSRPALKEKPYSTAISVIFKERFPCK